MEKNNKEKKETEMKTVGGRRRKLIITNHDDDADKKRSWSDLLHDILESIKKRLFFIDRVNFHLVCKSWSCVERVPSLQQIPWLFVLDNVESYYFNSNEKRKEKNMMDSCKLVDSKNKKTYTINANIIKDKLKIKTFDSLRVHESKNGWLLFSQWNHQNQIRLFLYSPFFSEGYNFIELPVLMNCYFFCATFTSNPLEKDCRILTISMKFPDTTIIMNTYGCGQGSWVSSLKFERKFTPLYGRNLMYSEGSLYYETGYDTMVKLDLALEEWTVLPRLPSTRDILYYKVKSSDGEGELFLITECNLNERRKCWHYDSRIYRLNLSSMIWEDLDSIGDRVLFFGQGYNSVMDSSVLKLNGERNDISDKIYYCKDNELRYCGVHDFTLKFPKSEIPPRKQNCLRHYGSIATKRCCRKMWIDPPPL